MRIYGNTNLKDSLRFLNHNSRFSRVPHDVFLSWAPDAVEDLSFFCCSSSFFYFFWIYALEILKLSLVQIFMSKHLGRIMPSTRSRPACPRRGPEGPHPGPARIVRLREGPSNLCWPYLVAVAAATGDNLATTMAAGWGSFFFFKLFSFF